MSNNDSLFKFITNFLIKKMDDSTSSYYLPNLIKSQKNPSYDPYIMTSLSLDNIDGLSVSLGNLSLQGLSNVSMDLNPVINDSDVKATATFLKAQPEPKQLLLIGDWTMTDPTSGDCTTGSLSATINQCSANTDIAFHIGDKPTCTVNSLTLNINPDPTVINITVTKVEGPDAENWEKFLSHQLNQISSLQQIVDNIQKQLNSDKAKSDFTTLINKQLENIPI